ncbi:bifunctional nuclease family protein [Limisalsivibrio acetivorans]|uniref:bifunctional nuclease family protein n=1 Tax=Limisalsivibrio acetivorans TaxID=1304888 RepID=UPI0003B4C77C|nr:bifunctional nuclease family protein [Limisalsivibrio acetivorans]
MYEIGVKCVIKEPLTSRYLLMMETICGDYLLPITIGSFEAEAIYSELNKIPSPRPMTYDFISGILSSIDKVRVLSLVIDDVKEGVYTAKMELDCGGEQKTMDCRPSDGIAIALRLSTPIFIDEEVLAKSSCIDRTCLSEQEERTLFNIVDDQGTTFWNV